jgi:branched-chain amino acid transport system substrate-binding protein
LFHKLFAPAMVASAIVALTAAGPEPPGKPIEIPVVVSLTGTAAFAGSISRDAIAAAETEINKQGGIRQRPIHFHFYDDQSEPRVAVQLTTDLVAKNATLMIGADLVATCKAMMPLLAHGPMTYCLSPGVYPDKGSYMLSAGANAHDILGIIYQYARERGWNRIATITSTDATGQIMDVETASLLKLPANSALKIVAAEHFNPSDLDVTAQISRLKAAQPQVLMGWTSGTPFGTVLRSANQLMPELPIMTSIANLNPRALVQYAGIVPHDLLMPAPPNVVDVSSDRQMRTQQSALAAALRSSGGGHDGQSSYAWDAAMLVREALRSEGPDATAEQYRAWYAAVKDFRGAAGVYDFAGGEQRGLSIKDLLIVRWDREKSGMVSVSKMGGTLR